MDGSVYEVVPSSWITGTGHGVGVPTDPSAYVFPSLNADGSADDPDPYTEANFFADGNHFRGTQPFTWQAEGGKPITFEVRRTSSPNERGVTIGLKSGSEASIRMLTWRQFDLLQSSFHHWLCGKSVFWPWESCESRFSSPPVSGPDNLTMFWKNTVLKSADFAVLDPELQVQTDCHHCDIFYHLKTKAAKPVSAAAQQAAAAAQQAAAAAQQAATAALQAATAAQQAAAAPAVQQAADAAEQLATAAQPAAAAAQQAAKAAQLAASAAQPVGDDRVDMYATLLYPGDALNIAWGLTALYPQKDNGVSSGYSRPSVGGSTEIDLTAGLKGPTLFPKDSWRSFPESEPPEQHTTDYQPHGQFNLVPFPTNFADLMANPPMFIPVYNSLDLRDARLLNGSAGPPRFLYLLSPKHYVKADAATLPNGRPDITEIAQYFSDARKVNGKLTEDYATEAALALSRRFLLIGCDQPTKACVTAELKALQCQAVAAFVDACDPAASPSAPVYTIGAFANQTYIEVRHHVSMNGRPLPSTVLDQETWGAMIARVPASLLDQNVGPGSSPLLRVRRTSRSNFGVERRITILFYSTSSEALGEIQVFEGDEFYAKSEL
jgi:hypothetical protein